METYWRGHEERWAAIFSPWLLLSMFVLVIKPVLTLSSVSVLVSVFAKEFFKCLFKQWWSALRGKYSNWSVKPWLLQDDVMHVIMCKISLEKTCDWGESGCQISGEPCIFLNQNSYTCKQPCRALFSQKLIFWKPSKRHLIFKWADRWKRVSGGAGVEMSWLMGQWRAVASEFMSQSKSEYWEHCHRVILDILRIIWQCIMLEICHAKKMSMPSLCSWNYNLRCSEEWLLLCQFSMDHCRTHWPQPSSLIHS